MVTQPYNILPEVPATVFTQHSLETHNLHMQQPFPILNIYPMHCHPKKWQLCIVGGPSISSHWYLAGSCLWYMGESDLWYRSMTITHEDISLHLLQPLNTPVVDIDRSIVHAGDVILAHIWPHRNEAVLKCALIHYSKWLYQFNIRKLMFMFYQAIPGCCKWQIVLQHAKCLSHMWTLERFVCWKPHQV